MRTTDLDRQPQRPHNRFLAGKEVIFFDGDGTLWYPKSTKRKRPPHWVYSEYPEARQHLKHLILTPSVFNVLNALKKRGMTLVALSTHPHPRDEADLLMHAKVRYFRLNDLFDSVYTARPYNWGKGKVIEKVLKGLNVPKRRALLVGDSYVYDYLSARAIGVDAILIKTPYTSHPARGRRIQRTITHLKQLLEYSP